ncbi:MAG: DUF3248 domain-containing protein [Trueperaceae bacterium]|nr:MAG: DUF3248 domain-containing protein [Trueperaceae bacterium]
MAPEDDPSVPVDRDRDRDDATTTARDDATAILAEAQAESLAGALLWRIGRAFEDGPVTVRVGLASSAPLFADLPRLRAATDQEVEAAIHEGDVQVEWVGPRLGGRA